MKINQLGEDKYEVVHDGKTEVLSLDEVAVLLSQPESYNDGKTMREQLKEFWNNCQEKVNKKCRVVSRKLGI